jgi:hypothetical protein
LQDKDFAKFGDLTMKDSNSFHATCLDTSPPIFYMNESSKRIVNLVHAYNDLTGGINAAYTFDAGTVLREYCDGVVMILMWRCDDVVPRIRTELRSQNIQHISGPNAVIYCPEAHMEPLLAIFLHFFSPKHHTGTFEYICFDLLCPGLRCLALPCLDLPCLHLPYFALHPLALLDCRVN